MQTVLIPKLVVNYFSNELVNVAKVTLCQVISSTNWRSVSSWSHCWH